MRRITFSLLKKKHSFTVSKDFLEAPIPLFFFLKRCTCKITEINLSPWASFSISSLLKNIQEQMWFFFPIMYFIFICGIGQAAKWWRKSKTSKLRKCVKCSPVDLGFLSALPPGNLVHRLLLFLTIGHLSLHFYKPHKCCFYQELFCSTETFPGKLCIHTLSVCYFFRGSSMVTSSQKKNKTTLQTRMHQCKHLFWRK